MSDTVKLIIELPKTTYEDLKQGKIYSSLCEAPQGVVEGIRDGIPLDNVKAEIEEKISHYDHFQGSNTAHGLEIALEIIDKHISGEGDKE